MWSQSELVAHQLLEEKWFTLRVRGPKQNAQHDDDDNYGAKNCLIFSRSALAALWGSYCFYDALKWSIVKVNDPKLHTFY